MGTIAANLNIIRKSIPDHVTLVAVSKTKPDEQILQAYNAGQRVFGENRVKELTSKSELLPKDIEWHMIGHLQANKVKYIAPFVSLIHSVDKPKLLKEINKEAVKNDRIIPVLLQFHIAEEETKYGFSLSEAEKFLASEDFKRLQHIQVCGVMGMATFTENEIKIRQEFQTLRSIFQHLQTGFFQEQASFKEISMGMSGDYQLAIEEGSTMVRIGSSIFGNRS